MIINRRICPDGLKSNPGICMPVINYITIHCTSNYHSDADAYSYALIQYNGNFGKDVSWHYTVDSKEIWQSFEDVTQCWHAGDGVDGPGNLSSIGIELCVNNQDAFFETCQNAATLTAHLLTKHNLLPDRVVQHNKWSAKDCPKELRSGVWAINWEDFLSLIKQKLTANELHS